MKIIPIVCIQFLLVNIYTLALAGVISKNNNFTPGTVISSSQINSNFDQLFTELNAKETRVTTLESATWTKNGALLYYNGGNVGIGTTDPQTFKLFVKQTTNSNTGGLIIQGSTNGNNIRLWNDDAGTAIISSDATDAIFIKNTTGNVGIGTNTPNYRGHVVNTATVGDPTTARQLAVGVDNSNIYNLSLGYYQTAGGQPFGGVIQARDNNVGTYLLLNPSGGNVGIGDTSPDTTLKVAGSLCVKSDANNCAGAVAGTIYANNTTVQNADYAEYFLSEEKLKKGEIVGLNTATGLARRYKSGDKLLGIVSTNPGVTGNAEIKDSNSILVAIMGQVPFDRNKVIIDGNIVKTFDGTSVGYLLSNGNIYININSADHDREIASIKAENAELKKVIKSIQEDLKKLQILQKYRRSFNRENKQ